MIPFLSLIAAGVLFHLATLACTGWLAHRSAIARRRAYADILREVEAWGPHWMDEGRWS